METESAVHVLDRPAGKRLEQVVVAAEGERPKLVAVRHVSRTVAHPNRPLVIDHARVRARARARRGRDDAGRRRQGGPRSGGVRRVHIRTQRVVDVRRGERVARGFGTADHRAVSAGGVAACPVVRVRGRRAAPCSVRRGQGQALLRRAADRRQRAIRRRRRTAGGGDDPGRRGRRRGRPIAIARRHHDAQRLTTVGR